MPDNGSSFHCSIIVSMLGRQDYRRYSATTVIFIWSPLSSVYDSSGFTLYEDQIHLALSIYFVLIYDTWLRL